MHQLLGVKSRVEERVAGIIFANVLLDSDGLSRQEKGHEISKIVSAVGPGFIMRMLQTTDPKMLTMKAALQLLAHACLSSSQLVLFAPHIDDFVRFILSYGEAAPRPAEAAEATSKAKATKDDGREQTLLQALIILQYVAASSADLHLLPTLHSLLRGATGTFAFPVLLLETSVQLLRHRLLNTRPASKAAAEQVLGSHASALRSLVVQCMHGLAPAETRRRALECLLQLLLLRPLGLGADWTVEEKQAFKDASTGPPSQGGEGKGQGQFALLVCAVLRGEMHIVAEGILALEGARVEPLSSSRGVSQANADGAAEPSALVAKKRTCLVCCLVFAHMLPLLVGDGEDEGGGDGEGGEEGPWAALPPSVLEGVRRQGHSIVQDGLSVLGECAALLQQQQQQQQDKQQQDKQQDKQQESARELRAFASALTATLCRWCSEDEALHAPLLDSLDAVLACSAVAGLARGREEEQLERVWGVLSCRGESASEWGAAEEAVLLMLGELGAPEGAGLGMGRGEDLLHRLLPTLLSMQEPGGDDDDEEEEEEEEDDEGGGGGQGILPAHDAASLPQPGPRRPLADHRHGGSALHPRRVCRPLRRPRVPGPCRHGRRGGGARGRGGHVSSAGGACHVRAGAGEQRARARSRGRRAAATVGGRRADCPDSRGPTRPPAARAGPPGHAPHPAQVLSAVARRFRDRFSDPRIAFGGPGQPARVCAAGQAARQAPAAGVCGLPLALAPCAAGPGRRGQNRRFPRRRGGVLRTTPRPGARVQECDDGAGVRPLELCFFWASRTRRSSGPRTLGSASSATRRSGWTRSFALRTRWRCWGAPG